MVQSGPEGFWKPAEAMQISPWPQQASEWQFQPKQPVFHPKNGRDILNSLYYDTWRSPPSFLGLAIPYKALKASLPIFSENSDFLFLKPILRPAEAAD